MIKYQNHVSIKWKGFIKLIFDEQTSKEYKKEPKNFHCQKSWTQNSVL